MYLFAIKRGGSIPINTLPHFLCIHLSFHFYILQEFSFNFRKVTILLWWIVFDIILQHDCKLHFLLAYGWLKRNTFLPFFCELQFHPFPPICHYFVISSSMAPDCLIFRYAKFHKMDWCAFEKSSECIFFLLSIFCCICCYLLMYYLCKFVVDFFFWLCKLLLV